MILCIEMELHMIQNSNKLNIINAFVLSFQLYSCKKDFEYTSIIYTNLWDITKNIFMYFGDFMR
jgi:hypothetical protein